MGTSLINSTHDVLVEIQYYQWTLRPYLTEAIDLCAVVLMDLTNSGEVSVEGHH